MALDRAKVREALKAFDFSRLFIEELGWDRPPTGSVTARPDVVYVLNPVAHKRGMVVFVCEAEGVPNHATRQKIEHEATKAAHEHLIIYTDSAHTNQVWQWIRREPGKPTASRQHAFHKSQPGDSLIQKLEALAFDLEEEEGLTITAVAGRARQAFDVDRVTRRFFDRFKSEHAGFLKFVKGIHAQGDREWYASLMLNRLMFVYFIQKKGFLDGDGDYLRNRLRLMQADKGKDKFHSFYRHFLLRLFHEGLGSEARTSELDALLGSVPYLNGGLFDVHDLERSHDAIEIADVAFEKIFEFFDAYSWHLDARPLRSDNEINPDVLGYIFEKYINQKQMGAYYTKEDITEYISRNTIIPQLFHTAERDYASAFIASSAAWRVVREDPDRYIYAAMLKGVDEPLPTEIEAGITHPSRRAAWNGPAPEHLALPSETWREHLERRERCLDLRSRLASGAVQSIEDFVALNLNIPQLAQDVVEGCEGPELLRAFFGAIRTTSILDPACGSGAFLFAALNMLEPLYEACLERMQAFIDDRQRADPKGQADNYVDFRATLDQAAAHPNRRYFILKSIILNNLFGVDVMEEAVEICKLRLFLRLAAEVDRIEDVEPLPDIDFNIRAGNSLVGFATKDEVRDAVTSRLDFDDTMARVDLKAEEADAAFRHFRAIQVSLDVPGKDITAAKADVRAKLRGLSDELDQYLARETGVDVSDTSLLEAWRNSHQPFHWFVEFYGIVNAGGFTVIIGNPPYVEIPKSLNRILLRRTFRSALDKWSRDEDLFTLFVERSLVLADRSRGCFGMILPLSIAFSTKRPFVALRELIQGETGHWRWSHYDRIPSALFGGEVRTRNTILLMSRAAASADHATTALLRWPSELREYLFRSIHYAGLRDDLAPGVPKVGSQLQADALAKLVSLKTPLARDLVEPIHFSALAASAPRFPRRAVYVGGTAYNWFPAWRDIPKTTDINGKPSLPARTAGYGFRDEATADVVFALLCSSLGYWWWAVASDGFNLKKWLLERFPISTTTLTADAFDELAVLGAALWTELKTHYVYKDNRGRIGNFFLPACRAQVEAIDDALAKHVPPLSTEFFEDVRDFNQSFARVSADLDAAGETD